MKIRQYQATVDEFRLFYNRKIFPELVRLEKRRQRLLYVFVLIVGLLLLGSIWAYQAHIPALTFFFILLISMVAAFLVYRVQRFRALFKPVVVNLILEFIDKKIEQGNSLRLQEMEQRLQAYNLAIKELEQSISEVKQKLYYKIEQRIEEIARQIEEGVEQDEMEVVRQRIGGLEKEIADLKAKIAHAHQNPDKNSEQRIADMEAERVVVEKNLANLKLTFEEGLEEQIGQLERQIAMFRQRIAVIEKRIGERFQSQLEYNFMEKIEQKTFQSSGIFKIPIDVYNGEDYIKGYVGNATFEMSELEVLRNSPVRNRTETIFRGIFFKANFFYDAGGKILFLPKEERQFLSETIRGIASQGGKAVSLQHPEFAKYFIAYATPDANVNNLLSKEAFQAIMDYKTRSSKQIYVSFVGGYVYIAITETKDILEPKIFASNTNYKSVREFFEDLLLIISIVEDFDLNH